MLKLDVRETCDTFCVDYNGCDWSISMKQDGVVVDPLSISIGDCVANSGCNDMPSEER